MEGTYFRINGDFTASVLCFDDWSDGLREAWVVDMSVSELSQRMSDVRSGAVECLTADLLADYDSLRFEFGSQGYILLSRQAKRGIWWRW